MKALFILYPQNVSKRQEFSGTGGYLFIDTIDNDDEILTHINCREDVMTDDDGTMRTDSGRIVWEEGYNSYDFGDYSYHVYDLAKLEPLNYGSHANIFAAIAAVNPWNMDEIEAIISANQ
jgi:hypothetical protein